MINENNQEEVVEDLPEIEEGEEDTTDYKALALKNQGIAKRLQTKLKKREEADAKLLKEEKPVSKEKEEKKEEKEEKKEILDRIDRAVLSVKGITKVEEIELVEKRKAETGRSLEDLLSASWFESELKELRESAISTDALPKGSQRTNQSAKDSVEYWIQKGEMPPKDQTELRRKVVNAKMKKQKDGNIFSDNPVV